jgi:hypothetical protein
MKKIWPSQTVEPINNFNFENVSGSRGTNTPNRANSNHDVVLEFRLKLRQAEEMIAKLHFNLREIRGAWDERE